MSKATQKYLASLILFGSNGIVASMIDLPSLFIVFARVSLGAALLVALVALSRSARTHLQAPKHARQALYLAVSGAALGVAWLFLFEAYRYVGVGVASLLFYCGPVIVMALSPMLFKTRLTAQKVLGFAAVTVGAFLVVGQGLGEGVSPWGLFLGAMSAVMYAVMVIFSKKVTQIGGGVLRHPALRKPCRRCRLPGLLCSHRLHRAAERHDARPPQRARRPLHRPGQHRPWLLHVLLVHG